MMPRGFEQEGLDTLESALENLDLAKRLYSSLADKQVVGPNTNDLVLAIRMAKIAREELCQFIAIARTAFK